MTDAGSIAELAKLNEVEPGAICEVLGDEPAPKGFATDLAPVENWNGGFTELLFTPRDRLVTNRLFVAGETPAVPACRPNGMDGFGGARPADMGNPGVDNRLAGILDTALTGLLKENDGFEPVPNEKTGAVALLSLDFGASILFGRVLARDCNDFDDDVAKSPTVDFARLKGFDAYTSLEVETLNRNVGLAASIVTDFCVTPESPLLSKDNA